VDRPYSHSARRRTDSKKVTTAYGILPLIPLAITLVVLCCIYIYIYPADGPTLVPT